MIIQCRKCGTKYRFDKMKVTGKGVWVRCRNCETVFFQKNPLAEISSLMDLMDPERTLSGEAVEGEGGEDQEAAKQEAEAESEDTGQEPTWEDAYRDAGGEIETKEAEGETPEEEVEKGGAVEEVETEEPKASETEQEPTWEDAYHEASGTADSEETEETDLDVEEAEAGGTVPEFPEEDLSRDAGEGIAIGEDEEIKEEEKAFAEGEAEGGEPEPVNEDISGDTGEEMRVEESEGDTEKIVGEPEDIGQGPQWEETYEDVEGGPGDEGTRERQRVREPWAFGDADEVIYNEKITGRRRLRRLWTLGWKVVLSLVLLALLAGGVYLWLVPEAREMVSNRVSPLMEKISGGENKGVIEGVKEAVFPQVEKMLGIGDAGTVDKDGELSVTLTDVGERFVTGWTAQTIMVVEGSAVNTNTIPVSRIQVRGKILDGSGNVLSREESHCGTILTDDELKSMTGDEIRKELSNPYGRDFRNADIQPGDSIPFMLVFVMPAEEASELVVELGEIEAAKGS